ncbi:hypothetical protein LOD99_12159 [Oopsacas minuta]|uniref:Cullin family profile domain-containing protein n=1 Tax=Oopsacas minuta TaxID=111878 RepID=A0AAV7JIT5_9METZ|nr:hypothetical protein LOD99_12159 [Oopsacas minuta]
MNEHFNCGDFVAEEMAKETALESLIENFTHLISDSESIEHHLLDFLDIKSFFSKPFEEQDSSIARNIDKCVLLLSPTHSLDSLFYSLCHLFAEHREFIYDQITEQFIEIFKDKSSAYILEQFFIDNPQSSLSTNKTLLNSQTILIQLFYQNPFLIASELFITSLIELEFHNYSLNLQDFILQQLDTTLSLSKHFLSSEIAQEFSTTILPSLIQHKCIDYHSHNLFSLIVNYPDSLPRLSEFKSLLRAKQSTNSIDHFQYESITCLLHPGSNTTDILTYYLSAIQAIHTLGRPYYVIDLISNVIFAYLKGRDDTFRCIISTFLTQKYSNQQMVQHGENMNPLLGLGNRGSEDRPLPSFFYSSCAEIQPSTEDIVSIFTNIYGSKELFISEYRTLLADRILAQFDFDLTTESSNLAKLETKFGESYFTHCRVMLKDIAFSLEFHATLQVKITNSPFQLLPYILSHNFWPTFVEENLKVPEELYPMFDQVNWEFRTLKSRRTLEWKVNIGLVQLEVSLKHKKIRFSVSPLHAIILFYFKQKSTWTLRDMASILKVFLNKLLI